MQRADPRHFALRRRYGGWAIGRAAPRRGGAVLLPAFSPIIVGAAALEVPKALRRGSDIDPLVLIAGAATGITAYVSIAFLMHYFRRHEFQALNPFAYYCWVAGATALVALVVF
jgi:undecaprenyl pyrophosphate phosphatase UppP